VACGVGGLVLSSPLGESGLALLLYFHGSRYGEVLHYAMAVRGVGTEGAPLRSLIYMYICMYIYVCVYIYMDADMMPPPWDARPVPPTRTTPSTRTTPHHTKSHIPHPITLTAPTHPLSNHYPNLITVTTPPTCTTRHHTTTPPLALPLSFSYSLIPNQTF
jgi:hypothetical protein